MTSIRKRSWSDPPSVKILWTQLLFQPHLQPQRQTGDRERDRVRASSISRLHLEGLGGGVQAAAESQGGASLRARPEPCPRPIEYPPSVRSQPLGLASAEPKEGSLKKTKDGERCERISLCPPGTVEYHQAFSPGSFIDGDIEGDADTHCSVRDTFEYAYLAFHLFIVSVFLTGRSGARFFFGIPVRRRVPLLQSSDRVGGSPTHNPTGDTFRSAKTATGLRRPLSQTRPKSGDDERDRVRASPIFPQQRWGLGGGGPGPADSVGLVRDPWESNPQPSG